MAGSSTTLASSSSAVGGSSSSRSYPGQSGNRDKDQDVVVLLPQHKSRTPRIRHKLSVSLRLDTEKMFGDFFVITFMYEDKIFWQKSLCICQLLLASIVRRDYEPIAVLYKPSWYRTRLFDKLSICISHPCGHPQLRIPIDRLPRRGKKVPAIILSFFWGDSN